MSKEMEIRVLESKGRGDLYISELVDTEVKKAKFYIKRLALIGAAGIISYIAISEMTDKYDVSASINSPDSNNNNSGLVWLTPVVPTPTLQPTTTPEPTPTQSIQEVQKLINLEDKIQIVKDYFDPAVSAWTNKMHEWALLYNIDPIMQATIMQIESCGDPNAYSPADARGLFQVVPYWHLPDGHDPDWLFDPDYNAKIGLSHLRDLLDHEKINGDFERAAMVYNGGTAYLDPSVMPPSHSETDTYRTYSWMYGEAIEGEKTEVKDYYYSARYWSCARVRIQQGQPAPYLDLEQYGAINYDSLR